MSRFRLRLLHGTDALEFTEWEDELVREGHGSTAAQRVLQLRREYPDAAIAIEREGDDRKPNVVKTWRFKIDNGKDAVYYSRVVNEVEYNPVLNSIREEFPKARITPEVITG